MINKKKKEKRKEENIYVALCVDKRNLIFFLLARKTFSTEIRYRIMEKKLKIYEHNLLWIFSSVRPMVAVVAVDPIASDVRGKIQATIDRRSANLVVHFSLSYLALELELDHQPLDESIVA